MDTLTRADLTSRYAVATSNASQAGIKGFLWAAWLSGYIDRAELERRRERLSLPLQFKPIMLDEHWMIAGTSPAGNLVPTSGLRVAQAPRYGEVNHGTFFAPPPPPPSFLRKFGKRTCDGNGEPLDILPSAVGILWHD